jgi:hypothetical protein
MGVIQHSAVAALDRHPPKAHAMGTHSATSVGDRGKLVRANPTTGAIEFTASTLLSFVGDPVSPSNGDVWYDSLNDRIRVKLATGVGTLNVTLDP